MANKTFKGRISNKHDTSANWLTASNNGFIPLDGEIIIYDDLNRIKIGDGSTKVDELPFLNYSEEEIQELINDSLSELKFNDEVTLAGTDFPYISKITQNNGLISAEYNSLGDFFSPIYLEIETTDDDGIYHVLHSSQELNAVNLIKSKVLIIQNTNIFADIDSIVLTLSGNTGANLIFTSENLFEYGDFGWSAKLKWTGQTDYIELQLSLNLINDSSDGYPKDNETTASVGFHGDSGKLTAFIPDYKGDDNWILLDENNQFYHKNNITAKTAFTHSKTTADPGYNGTFKILDFKYDSAGHITELQPVTVSMPDAQTLPTSFTITPNITGDEIINVASQTAGANGFSVKLEHEAPFSLEQTAKTASTTAVSGYGSSGSIKVPKVSVDKFGHVTELTEETVNITMPAEQTSFTIIPDITGDGVVLVESQEAGPNSFSVKLAHDSFGAEIKADTASTKSISGYGGTGTLKIPKVIRDAHGHVSGLTEESVSITMPSKQTIPTSFNITPNIEGDGMVIVESQSASANGFNVKLAHDKVGDGTDATTASTTTISGYGEKGTLKIPKITRDEWGHIDGLTEETVTINMPAAQTLPTGFNINATGTGDAVISVVGTGGKNSVHYSVTHDEAGTAYTSGNTTTSIGVGESKTIKIPQITVDKYGHTNTAVDADVTITIPAAPTVAVSDDDVVNLTVSTSGTTTTITGTHIDDKTAYTSGNTTVSVDVAEGEGKIKIPQLTTDKYGHVVVAADEEITFKAIQFASDYDADDNKAATMADVTAAVANLNGAMHFKGVVTTEPNGTTPTGYSAGDVVIYQQKDAEGKVSVAIEYVFDGTTWYKLGDESLPQKIVDEAIAELKLGAITNNGNVDSATVDIITSLSQSSGVVGGSKETLNFNTAPSANNKIATMTDITNKINGLDVTGVDLTQAETINVLKQTDGKISVSKQSILITSDQVSDFDDRVGDSINELDWAGLDLTPGETIDTISQTDGKVTGTKQAIAITASQVTDFATEVGKIIPEISVTTDDDGMAKVSATATGHSLTINTSHTKVGTAQTSASNSGSVSGYGASKTITIPKISTDDWGHVASITDESVTITMPSVSDTKMTQTAKSDNVNYPLLAASSASPTSGSPSTGVYNTGMTINPSTNTIKAGTFQGNLDGVADAAQILSDSTGNPLTLGTTIQPVYFEAGKPVALPEPVAPHRAGVYFVKDTAGASTTAGTWKAQCDDITEYYDGLTIALQVPIAGASTTTLNINDLGGKTVYRYGTSKVTSTHYTVGTVIILVYSATKNAWYTTDYDSNTYVTQAYSTSNDNYPILLTKKSGIDSTDSRGSTTAILNNQIYANPSAGTITATGGFIGDLTGTASDADHADAADVATALSSSAGSAINPIYFKDGKPEACTYGLNKTVPFNAVFTDRQVSTTLKDTTTIAYLLGTSTTPTAIAQSVTAIADTGVYLDTAAGTLTATTFKGYLNGNADSADHADVATSATFLSNYSLGSSKNPIFIQDGLPIACTYSLNKTVPENAVFTDTQVTQTVKSDNVNYPLLAAASASPTSGNASTATYSTGITINPKTNTITASTFKGNLDGNASSADLADAVQGTLKIQANGADKVSYNGSTSPTLNIATGTANGTISVGGTNVSVKGLGSNAYSSTSYLPTAGGTITGDILFDASGTTQANEPALTWGGIGTASPFIGYADDQNDGTFLLMSLAGGSTYKNGLAIGGSSGNLLWKGSKVTTVDDIGELDYTDTAVAGKYVSEVDQSNGLISVTHTYFPTFHRTSGTATGTKTTNATNSPAVNARSTTSGRYYGVEADATGAMYVNVPWTDNNTDTKVKQSPSATDGEFPILLRSTTAGTTEITTTASFKATTTINPSSGRISIKTSEPTIYGSYGAVDVSLTEGDNNAMYASNGILYSNGSNGANMYYDSTEKCITFEFY